MRKIGTMSLDLKDLDEQDEGCILEYIARFMSTVLLELGGAI